MRDKKRSLIGKTENYKFTCHKACEFFPCHEGVDEDEFNCLFCYCPLYALGEKCGGRFEYTDNGIKDCSGCNIPHIKGNYNLIISRFEEIRELAKKK